jgi:hypothetical protein
MQGGFRFLAANLVGWFGKMGLGWDEVYQRATINGILDSCTLDTGPTPHKTQVSGSTLKPPDIMKAGTLWPLTTMCTSH